MKKAKVICNITMIISGIFLSFSVLLTFINVVTRYIFGFTIAGYTDFVCIGFAYAVMLGAAETYRKNMHFGVDVLVNFLPKQVQRYIKILIQILLILLTAFFAYTSFELTFTVKRTMATTGLPYQYLYFSAVLGMVLMFFYSWGHLIQTIKDTKKQETIDKNQGEEEVKTWI